MQAVVGETTGQTALHGGPQQYGTPPRGVPLVIQGLIGGAHPLVGAPALAIAVACLDGPLESTFPVEWDRGRDVVPRR